MRPHVLLDVDGVLGNFIEAVFVKLQEMLPLDAQATLRHDDVQTSEMFDSLPLELQRFKNAVYDQLRAEGGCMSIPVYDGAKQGVSLLRDIADITIVTSPLNGSKTWVYERELWLGYHFGIERKDIVHTSKKYIVDGDVFVDDKLEHAESWAKKHPKQHAVIWDRKYNRVPYLSVDPHCWRIQGWMELYDLVSSLV